MKLNQLLLVSFVGMQFILPASAADGADTNSAGASSSQIPAYTAANGTAAGSSEAAEIDALKKTVQDLGQKIQALEQTQAADQQTNTKRRNGANPGSGSTSAHS